MNTKNIVEEIKKFVEEESKKPENWWGTEFYTWHITSVYDYAKELAEKVGADLEIVELAALLHDIGSIIHGRKDHHITGAKIAEEKLNELNYPKDKIEEIKKCILTHRGSERIEPETIEARIIRDADSLSNFKHITGPFMAAMVYEKKNQAESKESVRRKFENSWDKLCFQESKEIIKPRYEAIMLLLK